MTSSARRPVRVYVQITQPGPSVIGTPRQLIFELAVPRVSLLSHCARFDLARGWRAHLRRTPKRVRALGVGRWNHEGVPREGVCARCGPRLGRGDRSDPESSDQIEVGMPWVNEKRKRKKGEVKAKGGERKPRLPPSRILSPRN